MKKKNLKSKYFCQMIEYAKGDYGEMWRAIKQVLPGTKKSTVSSIFENGKTINLDAHSLGTYETKMAARTGKRSILKELAKEKIGD